mgnify:CR=1 FL=1
MRPLNRAPSRFGAENFKTYQILVPKSTHYRDASCAEVDCPNYTKGWRTIIDDKTPLGQGQAHYIRKNSGRKFNEYKSEQGLTVFEFEPGQTCFDRHSLRLDKQELYFVKGGDSRGNPRGVSPIRHKRPEDWVEDFSEHQQTIADAIERG